MLGRTRGAIFNLLQTSSQWSSSRASSSETNQVTIRLGRPEDMPEIHVMIKGLATYEGTPDRVKLSIEDLIEDGYKTNPWFYVLIAEEQGKILGSAVFNRGYCTWVRRTYYLEELFVVPEARSKGIGLLLFKELCKMAVKEGVHRLDGHVLGNNPRAANFYSTIGAHNLHSIEGCCPYRLYRDRIEALANE